MAGEKLHEYDLDLCNYVCGNIREHFDNKTFKEWAKRSMGSSELGQYILEERPERCLLGDQELISLIYSVDEPGRSRWKWRAYEPLHERYVETVKEVRDELSKQAAEDWSTACVGFASRLKTEDLWLDEGIEIMKEWLWVLRRLLRSMNAIDFLPCPEGSSPTPTCKTRDKGSTDLRLNKNREDDNIERMRKAIQNSKKGAKTKSRPLIEIAGIRLSNGLKALRKLEILGEYKGFSQRPRRRRSQ